MRKLVLTLTLIFAARLLFAQTGTIKGKIVDPDDNGPLIGANVVLKGTTTGSTTDVDGNFTIGGVPVGANTLVITYIGFESKEINVNVKDAQTTDLGTIQLASSAIGLKEIEVIASIAIDRQTPVAVSTVKGSYIEDKAGNQEFPEVLRATPSVYVTKSGGGFGDSRINIRGFDQRNTAVMINGIPVNDMENGWVYWSNWAGLSDVTSQIQVQRGLGASKLAVPSVGGSINIITNAADMEKGGSASAGVGNDGYMKYALVYNSGLSSSGLAFSVQATHTEGNGYIDGTAFNGWSYFASLSKVFNDRHTINITGLGAPQWHNQRTFANDYALYQQMGVKYNDSYGYLDGEEFNIRKNFYHKPIAMINHYWNVSSSTNIATSLYGSWGRGGGSGDLGRINGRAYYALPKTSDGLLRLEDIRTWNRGQTVADFGADNVPDGNGQYTSGIIRRASMNEHNWYGIISNITHELNNNFNLVAGIDARSYRGLHYRRVENLLGLVGWLDNSDINKPNHIVTDEGRADGNEIAYNDDGLVRWLGAYGQLEYSGESLSAFISGSVSNQGFKRVDYFLYEDSDPKQESDWENFLGGTVKAGLNYNLSVSSNIFVNGGYFNRQPIFDNVFPYFTNDVNPDTQNQTVTAFEVGYGYRSGIFSGNLNLYNTQWGNRQFDSSVDADGDTQYDERAIFDNVAQLHQGVEIDFTIKPISSLTFNGMLSLGNWRYTDDFQAVVVDENNQVISSNIKLYMKDVKVADAAQTTMNIGANYAIIKGLNVYASYYMADNVYAQFNLNAFLTEGNQVWELPSYGLVDAGLSYTFNLGSLELKWNLNINNLLDEEYIAEAFENNLYDPGDTGDAAIPGTNASIYNGVYFGFGRTWNTGLKISF